LAASSEVCPFVEYLPAELSESPLRRELVLDELAVVDGAIGPPEKAGLGIELDREALARFAAGAK
jgi:L-alanine-DL-glutamate epimerase-like enolase superfamily enzyme